MRAIAITVPEFFDGEAAAIASLLRDISHKDEEQEEKNDD